MITFSFRVLQYGCRRGRSGWWLGIFCRGRVSFVREEREHPRRQRSKSFPERSQNKLLGLGSDIRKKVKTSLAIRCGAQRRVIESISHGDLSINTDLVFGSRLREFGELPAT
jgi:hypothetical protein